MQMSQFSNNNPALSPIEWAISVVKGYLIPELEIEQIKNKT